MNSEKIGVDKIVGLVDHTKLKPFETEESIMDLIKEAVSLGAYSICIEPSYLEFSRKYIDDNNMKLKIAAVADFPFGSATTDIRKSIVEKLAQNADEIDIVAPISKVKSGRFDEVQNDLNEVVKVAHNANKIIKVIVEDAYTTPEEKSELYKAVMLSGADFIKTSTGFEDKDYAGSLGNKAGAQAENIKMMADFSLKYNKNIGIKASGGVHSYSDALNLLSVSGRDADPKQFRIGASGTKKIKESASAVSGR